MSLFVCGVEMLNFSAGAIMFFSDKALVEWP